MKISDIISVNNIMTQVTCKSKKDALDILAKFITKNNNVSHNQIFDCLIARERLGSTGLGGGVAIPHGRLHKNILAGCICLSQAIDYDSPDNHPVDIIFGLVLPEESNDVHLKILAMLASMFSNQDIVGELRNAQSDAKLYSILTQQVELS